MSLLDEGEDLDVLIRAEEIIGRNAPTPELKARSDERLAALKKLREAQ